MGKMHDPPSSIRRASPEDGEQLSEMNRLFNGVVRTPEEIRLSLENHGEIVLVAGGRGVLYGFLCACLLSSFCYEEPVMVIGELFVRTDFRKRGIATGLLREIEAMARAVPVSEIRLETGRANEGARRFYEKNGYALIDEAVYGKIP